MSDSGNSTGSTNSTGNGSTKWGPNWSNNPYAPQIPYWLYFAEKANFAGFLIGAIFYGIVIVLFFQCLSALLSGTNRAKRGGFDWKLMAYVGAMFSFGTIYTAMNLNLQSISYIDNREFPGTDSIPPGPLGYQWLIHNNALSIVPNLMFILSNWLADGLLIYRTLIIYNMNYSIIAFPCLALLGSFSTGIWFIYQTAQPGGVWNFFLYPGARVGLPYFAISTGLNVLLTVMILVRLFMYGRNVLSSTGAPGKITGFCKAALTILIETCGLYAMNSLLFIVPWGLKSYVSNIFLPILAQTQVIAPLLIALRMANHTSLTHNILISGKPPSIQAKSQPGQEKSIGVVNLPGGGITSIDARSRNGELSVGFVEATIDLHQEKV